MSQPINRRDVLRAAAVVPAASYSKILGANDRINLGVVGCGNRGYYMMQVFQRSADVRVTAVCDVFGEKARRAAAEAPGAFIAGDHRRIVDRSDVDAVLVATPDHWHAAVSIDAMNAGKDVYVEKPLTFRMEEGPHIIRAADANRRICQVGLQQRSGNVFLKAKKEVLDAGLLGKVSLVETIWHAGAPYDLGPSNEPKPPDLDWNRFLGQVRWRPWNPHQYHNYRLYLDFGGGCLTDLFTHWIDVVHMFMGQDVPKAVNAGGGIYIANDDRTAPDTVNVLAEYDGYNVTYESTALPGMPEESIVFHGSDGSLWLNRNRFEFHPKKENVAAISFETPRTLDEDHVRNFIDCCRSRKQPNCPPIVGHRAAQVCLLAKTSYLQRRRVTLRAPHMTSRPSLGQKILGD